jgi:hypothetical protein
MREGEDGTNKNDRGPSQAKRRIDIGSTRTVPATISGYSHSAVSTHIPFDERNPLTASLSTHAEGDPPSECATRMTFPFLHSSFSSPSSLPFVTNPCLHNIFLASATVSLLVAIELGPASLIATYGNSGTKKGRPVHQRRKMMKGVGPYVPEIPWKKRQGVRPSD